MPNLLSRTVASKAYTSRAGQNRIGFESVAARATGVGVALNQLFGVNLNNAEKPSPAYATATDFNKLKAVGINKIRYPIAWENAQPTLLAALSGTFTTDFDAVMDAAAAAGCKITIGIHNFGCKVKAAAWGTSIFYAGNAGTVTADVNVLGDGILTSAALDDFAVRLVTRYGSHAAFDGIGLMNETTPSIIGKNIIRSPNYPGNTTGDQAWSPPQNGATLVRLAEGTNQLGSNYGAAWELQGGSYGQINKSLTLDAVPHTLSFDAWVPSGTTHCIFGSAGPSGLSEERRLNDVLLSTTPQRLTHTFTPVAGLQPILIENDGPDYSGTGPNIRFDNVQLELSSSATAYAPSAWMPFALSACQAIEAVKPDCKIYINGYGDAKASSWLFDNFEMAQLKTANRFPEAHVYFDGPQGVGGGGIYSGTFASYGITSSTGAECLQPFLDWCDLVGWSRPFIGEIGAPDTADWRSVLASAYAEIRARGGDARAWNFGANGGSGSDPLNMAFVTDDPRLLQLAAA